MSLETVIVKEISLDKESKMVLTYNEASQRLFVEFKSTDGKMRIQKSFQDTFLGRRDSEKFQNKIKSISDLKNYFKKK